MYSETKGIEGSTMQDTELLARAKHVLRSNQVQMDALKDKWRDGSITKDKYMQELNLLRARNAGIRSVFGN